MTPTLRVLATAGHVDHGKSTLVEALTGTHPDRLKEEREREMTIDLGFGYLDLPGGLRVGIVDVPGHRDFIDNMLSGVGGVDAALLVVAADEGPMPQTREHLAILDLLGISCAIVALTKTDRVAEAGWLEMIRREIAALLEPTALRGSEIIPVSARTGAGIPALKQSLAALLGKIPPRRDQGRPRLPIDRVFTLTGFGTIVTGTLADGSFQAGQEVAILPGEKTARIRSLQAHNEKIESAGPGMRVAVNLTGVEPADLRRGQVVAIPGTYAATKKIDLRVRILADADAELKHNSGVKLYLGAAETMARARILGADAVGRGSEGWAQLVLAEEIVAARGDRVVLRRPSPGATIGGGTVIDAQPEKLHRRFDAAVLARLDALGRGGLGDRILQALAGNVGMTLADALRSAEAGPESLEIVAELIRQGELIVLSGDQLAPDGALVAARGAWETLTQKIAALLGEYHREHPLRTGMPRESLRARVGIPAKAAGAVLARAAADGWIVETQHGVKLAGFERVFTPGQRQTVEALLARIAGDPYQPPSIKDCLADVGADLYAALVDNGTLQPVSEDVVFLRATFDEMVDRIRGELKVREKLTVAETRDLFGSSRRYILALLGYLDAQGITTRDGDYRYLKEGRTQTDMIG
jgi:selenocysteine-specific elongation factor